MKKIFKLSFLLILCSLFLSTCKSYKQIYQTKEEFIANKSVKDAFSNYTVYVHDKTGSYHLEDPKIEGGVIKGRLALIKPGVQEPGILKNGKEKEKHLYDLNIYTFKDIEDPKVANINADKNDETNINKYDVNIYAKKQALNSSFELKQEDIEKVSVYALDKKESFKTAGSIILGIALLALLAVGIILLISYSVSSASNSSSNASSNSSAGSNSGGSNSGGSNSGGSGSSGCYIATMVYGNYDAPEVMVLRRFRDEVLDRSKGGRAFIRTYYKYSPRFVKRFKNNQTINTIIKHILNTFVSYLSKKNINAKN